MISIVVVMAGVLFVSLLTFGVRARQPLAIVAAFGAVATLYCWFGFAMSGMYGGDRFAVHPVRASGRTRNAQSIDRAAEPRRRDVNTAEG